MHLLWGLYQFQEIFQRLEPAFWLKHVIGTVGVLNEAQSNENVFSVCLSYQKMYLEREEGLRHLGFVFKFCVLAGTSIPRSEIYNFSPKTYCHSPQRYFRSPGYSHSFLTEGKTETSTLSPGGDSANGPAFWHRPCHLLLRHQLELGETARQARLNRCISIACWMSDLCTGMRNTHFICGTGRQRSSLLLQWGF